jgi:hypothetical protein
MKALAQVTNDEKLAGSLAGGRCLVRGGVVSLESEPQMRLAGSPNLAAGTTLTWRKLQATFDICEGQRSPEILSDRQIAMDWAGCVTGRRALRVKQLLAVPECQRPQVHTTMQPRCPAPRQMSSPEPCLRLVVTCTAAAKQVSCAPATTAIAVPFAGGLQ